MARSFGRARLRTLRGRLLLWHALAVLGVLLILGAVLDGVLEHYFIDQLTNSLVSDGRAVQQVLPSSGPVESEVVRLGHAMGVRITVIRTDGVVLADSEADPATMENHRTRPEVIQALSGDIGVSSRPSATIGIPFRYVALPPRDGRIVRVALPLTDLHSRITTVRVILAIGFALAALAGIGVLALIARNVSRPLGEMAESVSRLTGGDFDFNVPERGTGEVAVLGQTLNRMRGELAARMDEIERDRGILDAILSSLSEGVVLFGPGGHVIYQNRSAVGLLGGPVEQIRNLAPAALQRLVERAASVSPTSEEIRSGEAPGTTIQATATPIAGEANVLLVLRDVTEPRRLESIRRDFVANASHELKTPTASAQALAETIASAARDDPLAVPRFAEQLEQEVTRMARVVTDLLDLSRLEGEPGERSEVWLDRLVREEAERHQARARELGLGLAVDATTQVKVMGSARDLSLLVRNLVENALQYTRPGGWIDVGLSASEGRAVLRVRDSGLGIPSKDLSRVFERFYRVDRARSRETGGTGLGLSIVKHVAESHEGTVRAESRLGEGSTFTVRLPLAEFRTK